MADPRRSVELLDQLEALGFSDDAFQLLHHSRTRGWRDTISRHRAYCAKVSSFRRDGDAQRDQRRLQFVLQKYQTGGYAPGRADLFAKFSEEAFEEIPPFKTVM